MKEIELTQGYVVTVDDEDYDKLSQFSWYPKKSKYTVYAIRRGSSANRRSMHRMIMQPSDDMVVDHLDGDGLNNQRHNLRVCTHSQNSRNRRKTRKEYDNFIDSGIMYANLLPEDNITTIPGEVRLAQRLQMMTGE